MILAVARYKLTARQIARNSNVETTLLGLKWDVTQACPLVDVDKTSQKVIYLSQLYLQLHQNDESKVSS